MTMIKRQDLNQVYNTTVESNLLLRISQLSSGVSIDWIRRDEPLTHARGPSQTA